MPNVSDASRGTEGHRREEGELLAHAQQRESECLVEKSSFFSAGEVMPSIGQTFLSFFPLQHTSQSNASQFLSTRRGRPAAPSPGDSPNHRSSSVPSSSVDPPRAETGKALTLAGESGSQWRRCRRHRRLALFFFFDPDPPLQLLLGRLHPGRRRNGLAHPVPPLLSPLARRGDLAGSKRGEGDAVSWPKSARPWRAPVSRRSALWEGRRRESARRRCSSFSFRRRSFFSLLLLPPFSRAFVHRRGRRRLVRRRRPPRRPPLPQRRHCPGRGDRGLSRQLLPLPRLVARDGDDGPARDPSDPGVARGQVPGSGARAAVGRRRRGRGGRRARRGRRRRAAPRARGRREARRGAAALFGDLAQARHRRRLALRVAATEGDPRGVARPGARARLRVWRAGARKGQRRSARELLFSCSVFILFFLFLSLSLFSPSSLSPWLSLSPNNNLSLSL